MATKNGDSKKAGFGFKVMDLIEPKVDKSGKDDMINIEDITTAQERAFLEKNPEKIMNPKELLEQLDVPPQTGLLSKASHWLHSLVSKHRYGLVSFFLFFVMIWILLNIPMWEISLGSSATLTGFDPFPFKTLTFIVSFVGALFSQVILLAQKRVEERERKKTDLDLRLSLKQEVELRLLSEQITMLRDKCDRLYYLHEDILKLLANLVEIFSSKVGKKPSSSNEASRPPSS